VKTQFHPEAYEEMLASARFYEEKAGELGADFLTAVEETIRRIEEFPEAGPVERGAIRKRLVLGFPFTVLYEDQRDRIFIAAVMHQHRRPGYWQDRSSD
jgi:plasmid stabilization system protein ParE